MPAFNFNLITAVAPTLKSLIAIAIPDEKHDWIAEVVGDALESIPGLVDHLTSEGFKSLNGEERIAFALAHLDDVILKATEDVPKWSEVPDAAKQKLLDGLAQAINVFADAIIKVDEEDDFDIEAIPDALKGLGDAVVITIKLIQGKFWA